MKKTLLLALTILLLAFYPMKGQNNTDSSNCVASFNFKIDRDIKCFAPCLAVQFVNQSWPDSAKYLWDFGDGNTSNEKNPFHIYNLIPRDSTRSSLITSFKACLTIFSKDGCTSSFCGVIADIPDTVPELCSVHFTYHKNDSIISIPEVIPYQFTGISTNKVSEWHWDFGDGGTSTEQNPQHSFNFMDTSRLVCLKIVTASGCISSYCQEIYINAKPCKADFEYFISKSLPPIHNFKDLSEGDITKWYWDFGDGTYSYEKNPDHIFKNPTFQMHDSGGIKNRVYKVCLTISGYKGCMSTKCEEIFVPIYDSIPRGDCNYRIVLNYNQILGDLSCSGSASATLIDRQGTKHNGISYKWSNGSTESYTTGLCSNFPYYVIITSSDKCETAASFALMDYSSPVPYIGFWQYKKDSLNYKFETTVKNDELKYEWEFENGEIKQGEAVTYNYESPADKVVLRIKDASGNIVYTENIYLKSLGGISGNTNNLPNKGSIRFYPNPVSDVLYIELKEIAAGRKITAEVYDATGKNLISKQFNTDEHQENIQLDVTSLSKGLYFVKLKNETKPIGTVRFIK